MKPVRILPLLCLMLLSASEVTGASRFADVTIRATHVSASVHMLEGAGGNIGLSIGADGTLIVDDQFAELGPRIMAAIDELGGERPKLILNTHFHGDHTGSNPMFGETGTIISHDNVRVRLLSAPNFPRSGLPLVTYSDAATVHFNDDTIELIHLPDGHTDGDSAVWFRQANVIHMGDHFFNGRFPFVDTSSGGSVDGFIANVEHILERIGDDVKIIPGHGALATRKDLRTTIDTVSTTSQRIRTALAAGESVSDIAAGLDADFPGWGSGFINAERWVRIVEGDQKRTQP